MPVFRTIQGPQRHELPRIKGSRFLAHAAPASSAATAMAVVEAIRAEFPQASHHCFAWRLGLDADNHRSSDDGEPGGTAGPPILRRIDGHDLTDVVVVVVRWFGGTKLGMGGLVRAYGEAAAAVLDRCEVVQGRVSQSLELRCGYAQQGAVRSVLTAFQATPSFEDYGADVILRVSIPIEDVAPFQAELRERTAGRVRIDPIS